MLKLAPPAAIPPQRRVPDMVTAGFALRDFLYCCAQAVDEAESERPEFAEGYLVGASAASAELASPLAASAAVILRASARGRGPEGRAELFTALDAISLAVLVAMDDRGLLAEVLPDARAALAALLPVLPDCAAALEVIFAAACQGVTA